MNNSHKTEPRRNARPARSKSSTGNHGRPARDHTRSNRSDKSSKPPIRSGSNQSQRKGAAPVHHHVNQANRTDLPPISVNGRKNAEWYVLKLPDAYKDATPAQVMKKLGIPSKIADKLMRDKAVSKQRDRLSLRLFPDETPEFVAQWTDLNILYEDEFTLVVNKPAGLEIYPSAKGQTGTLANHIAAYYQGTGQACRVRHIHRLDKDTTGPVLYAKNELAHYVYDRDMREKKIERIYVAVVEGRLDKDKGTINQPIGKDRHHSTRRRVSQTGEHAITHYEVLERFADHTFVRLRLETGRTHQIRVHMSAVGHPLAGDGLYGGKRTWISRQALHGEQLLFNHAWTGKRIAAHAPLPEDFRKMLEHLRHDGR